MGAFLFLGPIVDCGGNADLEGVYGSVTIDGQPLADAMVTLVLAEGANLLPVVPMSKGNPS